MTKYLRFILKSEVSSYIKKKEVSSYMSLNNPSKHTVKRSNIYIKIILLNEII